MSDLTERARELLAGITRWPWSTVSGASNVWHFPEDEHNDGRPIVVVGGNHQAGHVKQADAEFIAAAPQLVTDLTAAVERVERLADTWESVGEPTAAKLTRDALEGK